MNFLFKGSGDTIIDEGVYSKGRMMRCASSSKYGAAGTHLYPPKWMVERVTGTLSSCNHVESVPISSNFRRFDVRKQAIIKWSSFMINEVTFNAPLSVCHVWTRRRVIRTLSFNSKRIAWETF
jgi:hypothetical protein